MSSSSISGRAPHILPSYDLSQTESTLSSLNGQPLDKKQRFVEHLASTNEFPKFIGAILEDPERLQAIADRSFPHKNGFDMLQLMMTDGYELRCHIWPEARQESQENVHNHRWDLASRILVGTLKQDFFQKVGEQPVQRTFLADPAVREELKNRNKSNENNNESVELIQRKRFTCQPRPKYFLQIDSSTQFTTPYKMTQISDQLGGDDYIIRKLPANASSEIPAGGSYSLEQSKFHRIVRKPNDPMTATLMLNTGPYAPACQVFSTKNLVEESASVVKAFTADDVRTKLESLLKSYKEANDLV